MRVSEFTTYASGDASQMSRDMRDGRAHVEASGGRPQGRLQAAVRHRRRGRVQDQPATAHASGPPLSRRWAGRAGASLPPTADQPGTDAGRDPGADRRPAHRAHRPGSRRRPGHDCLAPRPRGPAGPVDLDHPAGAPRRRAGDAGAAQAPAQLVAPLRGRGAQRVLAVGLHPLAPGRRERGRDPELARRPFALPALVHGVRAGVGRRRGGHVHRGGRRARLAGSHAHRQRRRLHLPLHRRPQRLRVPARLARHPAEERGAGPPADPGQDRALPA